MEETVSPGSVDPATPAAGLLEIRSRPPTRALTSGRRGETAGFTSAMPRRVRLCTCAEAHGPPRRARLEAARTGASGSASPAAPRAVSAASKSAWTRPGVRARTAALAEAAPISSTGRFGVPRMCGRVHRAHCAGRPFERSRSPPRAARAQPRARSPRPRPRSAPSGAQPPRTSGPPPVRRQARRSACGVSGPGAPRAPPPTGRTASAHRSPSSTRTRRSRANRAPPPRTTAPPRPRRARGSPGRARAPTART